MFQITRSEAIRPSAAYFHFMLPDLLRAVPSCCLSDLTLSSKREILDCWEGLERSLSSEKSPYTFKGLFIWKARIAYYSTDGNPQTVEKGQNEPFSVRRTLMN